MIKKILAGWYFLGIINLYELIGVAVFSVVSARGSVMMFNFTDLTIFQADMITDMIALFGFLIWLRIRR